jgi:LuxR family maltose regulon positive regulatory protein
MEARVLLVDDHPIFRQGLRHLLEKEKDLKVVGEAGDGLEAIDRLRESSPDIVVMDISMPNLDGVEATRQILSELPETKVVALSVHSTKRFVRDMLQAGATGYILKESVPEEMVQGIRTVLSGDVYLSRSISGIVVSEYKKLLSETEQPPQTLSEPILRTKLHPPPVSADIIPRIRLIELLEQGRHRPMTLISAPAGYGKSILASQWLETCGCPGAWVSLDEKDSDLRLFLTYLLEAVQKAFPAASLATKDLLQAATFPPEKLLSQYLLNDMEKVEEPLVLVLDDYHRIRKSAVHELLRELLRHPTPMLHLALLTRRDPPLPINNLRAQGRLTEIGVEHLRFTPAETTALLERFIHLTIDEKTASVLDERVEGWVVGLRLVALSLGQKKGQDRILQGLNQGSPYVREYLIQEVLSQVPQAFAQYLVETSVLDRFCLPLCNALSLSSKGQKKTEDPLSCQAFMDWLEETHLFVIPLDDTHTWFRYHHLFQDLLQSQLKRRCSSEEITVLHSRASEWFAENGLIDEAIQHALAADDVVGAARLVEGNRQRIQNLDRWYVLEKWLSLFPDTVIKQQPGLLMTQAWVLYHHFDISAIPSVIDAAEALLSNETNDQSLRGEMDFFRGYIYYFQNNGARSLKHLDDALRRIPESDYEIRGQSEILHGLASQMQGQKQRAVGTLNDLLYLHRCPETIRITRLQVTLVYIHIISGDLTEALLASKQLYDFAAKKGYTYARVWSAYLQGLIHFYRNDLEAAIIHFHQALNQKYVLHTRAVVDSMAGLAYAYQAMGQPDQAGNTIQGSYEHVDSLNVPTYSTLARSCHARLSIMQGERKSGLSRLDESPPIENMVWWLEIPAVTHCRLLLAEGSNQSLEKTEAKLRELLQLNQDNHNTCQMIQIMPLLALACKKQERVDEALTILERAIGLAEPGGWIRPFVELGPPLADLLKGLLKKNLAVDYIERLLGAFPDSRLTSGGIRSESEALSAIDNRTSRIETLTEPLTNRELEILELLAQRLQNKEIADKLFVSVETVKTHLNNIYQKLQVSNRREAVLKAKNLRIL